MSAHPSHICVWSRPQRALSHVAPAVLHDPEGRARRKARWANRPAPPAASSPHRQRRSPDGGVRRCDVTGGPYIMLCLTSRPVQRAPLKVAHASLVDQSGVCGLSTGQLGPSCEEPAGLGCCLAWRCFARIRALASMALAPGGGRWRGLRSDLGLDDARSRSAMASQSASANAIAVGGCGHERSACHACQLQSRTPKPPDPRSPQCVLAS